ncbi:MAG: hypothetical protein JWM86_2588, partial [Thermoleophilia bacterium]|nr:hypothetical protein [Thermoleophilia bacterium]
MPGILTPLRDRNFALFAFATATSMLGDGIALVAIAWQVYSLSDSATALGLVLTAWTLAQVPVSLIGGVAGDRMDRRRLLIASDVARCVIFVLIGVLALTDHLSLPGFVAIGMLYGLADGIYAPVAGAIIPDIVRADALVPANSLLGVLRPMSLRLLGPAAGGLIIAVAGTGGAFLVNAGTFAASGAALLLMRASDIRSVQPGDPDAAAADPEEGPVQALVRDVRESLGYVRQNPWLARSMLAATFVLIFYWGPLEVLVPYLAKHELGHGAGGLGVILACGGLGSMLASILVGQRGLPSRPLAFMYACWIVGCAVMAAYALADGLVLASAVAFVTFGIMTASWVAQA